MSDLADEKTLVDLRDALFGVYSARVIDIDDPDQIGRIKVVACWT